MCWIDLSFRRIVHREPPRASRARKSKYSFTPRMSFPAFANVSPSRDVKSSNRMTSSRELTFRTWKLVRSLVTFGHLPLDPFDRLTLDTFGHLPLDALDGFPFLLSELRLL